MSQKIDVKSYELKDLNLLEYHKSHLSIINQFIPTLLTPKEIEVLAGFMSLTGDLVEQDRFGTQARKIIMAKLNMTPGGLGNHLNSLINQKKYIYRDQNGKLKIREYLIPAPNVQGYQFKISMK